MSLPLQLDYSQSISELPECTNYEVTLTPSTGATTYLPGGLVKFDFQQRGFIDPSSIVVRYKYTLASASGAAMIATPAYAPFQRLETLIGSQVVESINQYNQVFTTRRVQYGYPFNGEFYCFCVGGGAKNLTFFPVI